jgi:hypothetical protein
MARLQFKTAEFEDRVVNLNLGTNRLGRAADSHVLVEHPTVSGNHCEVLLGDGQVTVRDCGSTNGTFVDGSRIQVATLLPGQTLRVGEVELLVADTEVAISIPKFQLPVPPPPIVLANGSLVCPRHQALVAAYQCPNCRELLCGECVHQLRRRGGKLLRLCPRCSHPVKALGGEQKKKKSLLRRLQDTTKLLVNRALGKN